MATPDPENNQRPSSRRLSGYWAGVATAVTVNLLTQDISVGMRILGASLLVYGVFRVTELTRRWHAESEFSKLVGQVALNVAFVLALVSLLGPWGGYLMFLAAALVAIAASTTTDAQTALVILGGMALLAAGPASVKAAMTEAHVDLFLTVWMLFGGIAEFFAGSLLIFMWHRSRRTNAAIRIPVSLTEYGAKQFILMGVITLLGATMSVGLTSIMSEPQNAVAFLPLVGICIAISGSGLLVLFPRERRELMRVRYREMTHDSPRVARSFGEQIRYLMGGAEPATRRPPEAQRGSATPDGAGLRDSDHDHR
jgi:hypothetical protein